MPDDVYATALDYCVSRRAMLIVDPKRAWNEPARRQSRRGRHEPDRHPCPQRRPLLPARAAGRPAARRPDRDVRAVRRRGRRDGPHRRPARRVEGAAGTDASLNGVVGLHDRAHRRRERRSSTRSASTACAPSRCSGAWSGARARCEGPTQLADEYKYIPVRRTALFIEESLYRGLKWVVFEPNDEPLWAQIRLNVGAFMHNLFRQGAFQGSTPRDAYFVKCDKETTTQNDINLGIVNIVVGFAPLKPAEFVDHQAPADGRPDRGLRQGGRAWLSSPSTRSGSIRTRTSSSASSGTARYVAGVSKVSALKRTTEVVKHREGGDPSTQPQVAGPHRVRSDHARARRHPRHGVRAVGQQGLELSAPASARRSRSRTSARTSSSRSTTRPASWSIAYKVYRCWVSEFQALADLDANANAVLIQHIKLENEGWERDVEGHRAERAVASPAPSPHDPTSDGAGVARRVGARPRRARRGPSRRAGRSRCGAGRSTRSWAGTSAGEMRRCSTSAVQLFGPTADAVSICPSCGEHARRATGPRR